jgi:serine/threonine protein kinase
LPVGEGANRGKIAAVSAEPPAPRSAHKVTLPAIPRSLQTDASRQLDTLTELEPGAELRQDKVFDVVERVGEGGMGKVFRAFDPAMDRYVALKVLKLDIPDTERRRFRREAVIAANFSHPNLPRVLDRGTDRERGLEWMIMEYLRGRDLGHIIDRGRKIAFPVLLDITCQTLDALDYIHTRKIAHCDIKPDNIFVTRDPYDRRIVVVKLIDFGVCRSLAPPFDLQLQLMGDPRYMAPEQTILNGPIDATVDLYALGLTFYEALLGEHPFPGADELDANQLLELQVEQMPALPSTRMPGLPGALAEALDAFVATACAKDPGARFPDARAMKTAIAGLRDAG